MKLALLLVIAASFAGSGLWRLLHAVERFAGMTVPVSRPTALRHSLLLRSGRVDLVVIQVMSYECSVCRKDEPMNRVLRARFKVSWRIVPISLTDTSIARKWYDDFWRAEGEKLARLHDEALKSIALDTSTMARSAGTPTDPKVVSRTRKVLTVFPVRTTPIYLLFNGRERRVFRSAGELSAALARID